MKRFRQEISHENKINTGVLFGDAVRNSISLILSIGGFIIIFSVVINLLLETGLIGFIAQLLSGILSPLGINSELITAVLSGIFEITTGSSLASSVKGIPIDLKLAAASLIIGWGGLSVHSQVISITSLTDISIKPYLMGKLLQGVIAAAYTWLGLKIFALKEFIPQGVLGTSYPLGSKWLASAASSVAYLFYVLAFFTILFFIRAAFLRICKKLF